MPYDTDRLFCMPIILCYDTHILLDGILVCDIIQTDCSMTPLSVILWTELFLGDLLKYQIDDYLLYLLLTPILLIWSDDLIKVMT